jgi:hypothetical protein
MSQPPEQEQEPATPPPSPPIITSRFYFSRNNAPKKRINIESPRWDQKTYWGRVRHFWVTTHPLNLLYSEAELDYAKDIVTRYRNGEDFPEEKLWKQKHIYDSAFHPESGEKMPLVGRISAQVPMNMFITGFMLTFYK